MRFLKVFGTGLTLFILLVIGMYSDTSDPSTRDGIGFFVVFGVLFYLPILFIGALILQALKKDPK